MSQNNHELLAGVRDLPIIKGLTAAGATDGSLLEAVLVAAERILVSTQKIYSYGNDVMMEIGEGTNGRLIRLVADHRLASIAVSLLANVFLCEGPGKDGEAGPQFAPPGKFLAQLLNRIPTRDALPRIRTYATRPIFDPDFALRGLGWHPSCGILVHGPEVHPIMPEPVDVGRPVLERLPPRLHGLLRDFCFRSAADFVNALAALLTGITVQHFIEPGKPLLLLDGDQPGLGKTLFARAIGIVLDGIDPRLINFTATEEELTKRICATLRGNRQSMIIIDNAKTPGGRVVSSPTIECNSVASTVSLRVLGVSANIDRPNDLLWAISMNHTKVSSDIASRGLPIRFHIDGDPARRNFSGRDPIFYAREHRSEILGELAGMVVLWNERGRPQGLAAHRCAHWATIIGGILLTNGFPELLANVDEATTEFAVEFDELTALAEAAVRSADPRILVSGTATGDRDVVDHRGVGLPPAQWEPFFQDAKILTDKLDTAKSAKAKSTLLGTFLARHIARPIEVDNGAVTQTLALRMTPDRAKSKLYAFVVASQVRARPGREPAASAPHMPPQRVKRASQRTTQRNSKASPGTPSRVRPTRQLIVAGRTHD